MKINFDEFTFKIDRWHGDIDFPMLCSKTMILRISFQGDSSAITLNQKDSIYDFISNYEVLWDSISQEIEKTEPNSNFDLNSTITLALSGIVSGMGHMQSFDYIIGYEAYCESKYIKSFMVCINNMQVSEVIVAR